MAVHRRVLAQDGEPSDRDATSLFVGSKETEATGTTSEGGLRELQPAALISSGVHSTSEKITEMRRTWRDPSAPTYT
jgi:hypothetical protein